MRVLDLEEVVAARAATRGDLETQPNRVGGEAERWRARQPLEPPGRCPLFRFR